MKIQGIRYGFATNSSSSHSVIVLPNQEDDDIYDQEFGWDNWTAASQEQKMTYLGVTISSQIQKKVGETLSRIIAEYFSGIELQDDGYIDHESKITLPYDFDGRGLSVEFIEDLKEALLRDDVVILGGNDNSDPHPSKELGTPVAWYSDIPMETNDLVCRKDGDEWTLFDRKDGLKIRMSFVDEPRQKITRPELVDVKITNMCAHQCQYCYQDSIPTGNHANDNLITNLMYGLSELECFEVALGGGDPILHPFFWNLLRKSWYNLRINFSTRSTDWLYVDNKRQSWLDNGGAIGFSICSESELRQIVTILKQTVSFDTWDWSHRVAFHLVMGVVNEWRFESILRSANNNNKLPIVLLGYKEVGRGSKYRPLPHGWWIDIIADLYSQGECPRISIDTVLASQYSKELKAAGIPSEMYETEECRSMYFDLVGNQYGPSSYEPDKMIKFGENHLLRPSSISDMFCKVRNY